VQAEFVFADDVAIANRFADPRPMVECEVCGGSDYADRTIHGGDSIIRQCRRCDRFMGFPVWYRRELERRCL
jgi:hypothetical protein